MSMANVRSCKYGGLLPWYPAKVGARRVAAPILIIDGGMQRILSIRLKTKIRMAAVVLMVFYIAALAYVCFFSERYGRTVSDTYRYNLQPFREISRFLTYRETIGFRGFVINLFGNIVVFMPWGFMVPVIRKRVYKFWYTVASTFLLSLCIETIQLVTRVGSFDVDDLILNTLGGIAGFLVYFIVNTVGRHIFGKGNL